jgi:dienelactone hydrolase
MSELKSLSNPIIWLLPALLLLAGCGADTPMPATPAAMVSVVASNTPLPAAIQTPSPMPPTATPTETFTPTPTSTPSPTSTPTVTSTPSPTPTPLHPLMIEALRQQTYPGSEITVEETLEPGVNYDRYVVSYLSEGYKIYGLLTIPRGEKPPTGWPVIIFNHGYIPPAQYRTTERYVAYADGFARNGYIVFKSDYRGHGDSEGEATGGYGSPAYTIDVLNAVSAVKQLPEADPKRMGMWGHSMGGHITLRSMVTSGDIKAGVIWAGVVASYPDLIERWRRPNNDIFPTPDPDSRRGRWRQTLFDTYGAPDENPEFWAAISPTSYLDDLSGPIQLHHGTTDQSVPVEFSETLAEQMEAAGLPVELHLYDGDNHNISVNFDTAMTRSIEFFDIHVKGQSGS